MTSAHNDTLQRFASFGPVQSGQTGVSSKQCNFCNSINKLLIQTVVQVTFVHVTCAADPSWPPLCWQVMIARKKYAMSSTQWKICLRSSTDQTQGNQAWHSCNASRQANKVQHRLQLRQGISNPGSKTYNTTQCSTAWAGACTQQQLSNYLMMQHDVLQSSLFSYFG